MNLWVFFLSKRNCHSILKKQMLNLKSCSFFRIWEEFERNIASWLKTWGEGWGLHIQSSKKFSTMSDFRNMISPLQDLPRTRQLFNRVRNKDRLFSKMILSTMNLMSLRGIDDRRSRTSRIGKSVWWRSSSWVLNSVSFN